MLITGTFVQPYQTVNKSHPPLDWTKEQWKKEFRYLEQIGINLIIPQFSVYDNEAYYFSEIVPCITKNDQLEIILSLADEWKFQIMVGLTLDSSYWYGEKTVSYWENEVERNKKFVDELWKKLGHHPSFWGWYIPHEIDDVTAKPEPMRLVVTRLLNEISSYCHKKTPGLPVSIAPFFSNAMPPDEYEKWWTKTLQGAGIDILMLQDGVGCHRGDIQRDIPPYYTAGKNACLHTGVEFWTDLEIFDQIHCPPVDDLPLDKWDAIPAKIKRVTAQIETTAPYVSRIVCFDFTHYMSPQMGEKQAKLFQDYKHYIEYR